MAQIILDNYDIAKHSLTKCRKHIHEKKLPILNEVEAKLDQSPEEAKTFILEQAEKMKAQLKLP